MDTRWENNGRHMFQKCMTYEIMRIVGWHEGLEQYLVYNHFWLSGPLNFETSHRPKIGAAGLTPSQWSLDTCTKRESESGGLLFVMQLGNIICLENSTQLLRWKWWNIDSKTGTILTLLLSATSTSHISMVDHVLSPNVDVQIMLTAEPFFCLLTPSKGAYMGTHSVVYTLLVNFQVVGASKGW